MATNYKAKFITATRELTAKERIAVKTFADVCMLDSYTEEHGDVLINLDYVAEIAIHNEELENPNYSKFVYVDKDGTMYVSGSETLHRAYEDIAEEMEDEEEEWGIKVCRKASVNFKGKDFLTCTII